MKKPVLWPPALGQIWAANSEWVGSKPATTDIPVGTRLLVVTEPIAYSSNDDSWAMEVVWSGGRRRLVAGPKDLTPLEWLVGA